MGLLGMSPAFTRREISLFSLKEMHSAGELELQPKFQRRKVWPEKARSFLIDTVVRHLPMPKIYLRLLRESDYVKYEVVDGQQRISAVLDYLSDNLVLMPQHNDRFGGKAFSELPTAVQRDVLDYSFTTEVIEDASDVDIWRLFGKTEHLHTNLERSRAFKCSVFWLFQTINV